MSTPDYKALLAQTTELSRRAGDAIMEIYRTDFEVEHKDDDSPLTQADRASHNIIVDGLAKLTPDWPILSEESLETDEFDVRSQWQRYWLVDPLDGTREFVKRGDDFTVNIALIENHEVRLGIVYVPVTEVTYYAAKGIGAFKVSFQEGN
ncbi:MAG: 3'(2'),5'-bisphosphate nucleotidase CysQ [Bacteroidota bacterium]